jgi:hypothetical protein
MYTVILCSLSKSKKLFSAAFVVQCAFDARFALYLLQLQYKNLTRTPNCFGAVHCAKRADGEMHVLLFCCFALHC